jgi:N-methylhydantoinase B
LKGGITLSRAATRAKSSPRENIYEKHQVRQVELDGITFTVLKNSFVTLVDEMAEQILRTCYSFVIFNRDFSCALNDGLGNTVMQGSQDIAVHVGTLHHTAKAVLEYFTDELKPNDVIAVNDPYLGGTHFPDVRIMRPVFYENDLIAITQTNGHWADVGGSVPGSFNVLAKEFYAEGLRITPVKLWEEGKFRRDVAELIANNMRVPRERIGDMQAQAAATEVGEKYLIHLVRKYGLRTVIAAFAKVQDYVETLLRERIKSLPKGTWEAEDYIDYDPGREYDRPVKIQVKMTIEEDKIFYDLSGSDKEVSSFLNGTFGSSYSAVIAGTKLFFPDIPLNSGFYRVVEANLPPGSVVNAEWPAPVTGFASGAYEKIMNCSISIWSRIIPNRAMACSYNLEYLLIGGRDRRIEGEPYFMWYDWMVGGYGGRNGLDGPNSSAPLFGMGLTVQPIEGQERLNPVLTTIHEIITDSGGPGKFRGGCGVTKGGRLLESRGVLMSYMADRGRMIPWGIVGGLPSIPQGVRLYRKNVSSYQWLGVYFSGVDINEGDVFERPSAGGGGYGDPLERDPKLVLEDVIDGYVSLERAQRDYGVVVRVIDPEALSYEIDLSKTESLRKEMQAQRKSWLQEDPSKVEELYQRGEIDLLDCFRMYGVVIDMKTNRVLSNTTAVYRKLMKNNSSKYWK